MAGNDHPSDADRPEDDDVNDGRRGEERRSNDRDDHNDKGGPSRPEPHIRLEDHDPHDDEFDEDGEVLIVEASLAELSDENGDIPAEDDELADVDGEEGLPSWLNTSVQYTWRGLVLILGIAALIYAATTLYLVTLPIIIALILSTLCVPPARALERRGVPRMLAAVIVVIGGIGTFAGIIALMTPAFIAQVQELQPTVAEGIDSVLNWLEEGPIGWDRSQAEDLFNDMMAQLEDSAGTIASSVGSIAMAVAEGLTALVLAIVLLFFFVKDGDQIVRWFITRVPSHHRDTFRAAGARGWAALSGFVRGTAAVALIDAVGIGIGLAIVGVPLVLPLSVLVFFGGFIPVIGATATGVLAALVALASGGITDAIIVAVIVLVVQQVESNVLQPTIMRRAVSLHPVVILGVLTGGAVLIGIVGAFLAVPVAAVLAAVGNELRLRHELGKQGAVAGPRPIGGPGVDPRTVKVQFPEDTQLLAGTRKRRKHDRDAAGARRRTRIRERVDARGRRHRDADQPERDATPGETGTGTDPSRPGAAHAAPPSPATNRAAGHRGPASAPRDGSATPSHVEVVRPPDSDGNDTSR